MRRKNEKQYVRMDQNELYSMIIAGRISLGDILVELFDLIDKSSFVSVREPIRTLRKKLNQIFLTLEEKRGVLPEGLSNDYPNFFITYENLVRGYGDRFKCETENKGRGVSISDFKNVVENFGILGNMQDR